MDVSTATSSQPVETARLARAVCYLRVSTTRQAGKNGEAEGYSIPAQRKECHRQAERLGAEIVDEFVDAGASARSADRPALQAMLAHLDEGGIDYVIVHKIDRLARDRADDVAIGLAIHRAGALLVSATEAVDESPSGTLLHGIMAAIAEFYSKNLSAEAKKGLHEKARRGGTPGYAPLGYLNVVVRHEGVEQKTIEVDPERAPHVTWAFETYATGQVSVSSLTDELERRGMKSRRTATRPAAPMTRSMVHRMLSKSYYTGRLIYGGVEYEGKHEALIDDETFFCVQAILRNRRIAGDRAWKQHQYLKGTLFCDRCGERLGFGASRGRSSDYEYFFCLGRHTKRNDCDLPYLPAEKVEAVISDHWRHVRFRGELCQKLEKIIEEEFDRQEAGQRKLVETQRRRVLQIERKKRKLLDAYLADVVPLEDLRPKQEALQQELVDARRLIESVTVRSDGVRDRLKTALKVLERADALYSICNDDQRATLNLAAFDGLYLDVDDDGQPRITESALNPEFASLIELARNLEQWQPATVGSACSLQLYAGRRLYTRPGRGAQLVATASAGTARRALTGAEAVGGSNLSHLAERVGFEPTVRLTPTPP